MRIHTLEMYQEFDAPVAQIWETFNDHVVFGKLVGQKTIRIKDSTEDGNVNGVGSVRKVCLPLLPLEETIRKSEKPTLIEYQITRSTGIHHHYGWMRFEALSDNRSALKYTIEIGSRIPLAGALLSSALKTVLSKALKKRAASLSKSHNA